jgi:DHA1 family bicyclomycin/chloramphenicol resistance-like MFS transporter
LGGWRLSFELMGVVALLLAAANLAFPLIPQTSRRARGTYRELILDPVFLRYALSQAFVLGGLLVFVFGAPAVLVRSFGGTLTDFVLMQVAGISAFTVAANVTGLLAAKYGAERLIALGTWLAVIGTLSLLAFALADGKSAFAMIVLFVPLNTGLGLRGPPGFYRAVLASRGDDARGSAIVIVATMAATAAGTAIVAPLIEYGLVPLAWSALALEVAALACLLLLPKLQEDRSST